jgi:hypothetical protein
MGAIVLDRGGKCDIEVWESFLAKTMNEMKGEITYLSHLAVFLLYTKNDYHE